ncbi:Wadjet anti-phage system protein JetD domain-containing protein [Variovorax rhizosphaerae]|uniref:Wadjet anti-phage system protein JetD domain-containing protein n=1 Tax=Variovorax rhizosphaerae TaxID=1836200 RepID=A0ABU8WNH5_9BURK
MNWTQSADLRGQVLKLWERGDLLSSMATGEPLFPRRLQLRTPTSAEMTDRFDAVRAWSRDIRASGCRVVMREFRHRVLGDNALPQEAWVDSMEEALALIGKRKEGQRFATLVAVTQSRQPLLLPWLARRPLRALELAHEWQRLLAIVAWVEARPRPGVYLRQVDIPGVHTKFIEAHRGVLSELLDLVLPAEVVEAKASGIQAFAQRYGFRDKGLRIRFRILDAKFALGAAALAQDIAVDAPTFARLDLGVSRVFITENEINFLAFPPVESAVVIFGSGYGFEMLAEAGWLNRTRVHYWGDIDTHGFAILDQLRARFAHVDSFLMDRATLMAHETQWVEEATQTLRDLPRLRPPEQALYDDLRDNRLRPRLRLEQERIGYAWVESALALLA